MSYRHPKKHLNCYLSKKDIIRFFNIPKSKIEFLIKEKLLTPLRCGGETCFNLSEILQALFSLIKKH